MNRSRPSDVPRSPEESGAGASGFSNEDARPGQRGGRPRILLTILLLALATVPVVGVASVARPPRLDDFPAFTVLLVAAAASAGLRFAPGKERVFFSFTAVVLLAAIPLVGPLWATVLGVGAAILDARQGWWQAWFFNGVMFGLSAAVASLAYALAGGAIIEAGTGIRGVADPSTLSPVDLTVAFGIPLLVADIALIATNLAIILLVTPVDPVTPSRRPVLFAALRTVPTYLAWALVAFVVVVLWVPGGLRALAPLLILAPLIVARHIHGMFSTERRVRSSIIDALARAGRDDGTEAHGERVARYASAIAGELGLRQADRSSLQYAARLHAVGMSGPCTPELRVDGSSAGAVTAALAGHRLTSMIPFLNGAALTVRHEGEWVDGSGGPARLEGDLIPLQSRILAVADAADVLVMESDATHPEQEAVAQVRRWSGRRFDPEVVDALVAALGLAPSAQVTSGEKPRRAGTSSVRGRGQARHGRTLKRGVRS